MQLQGDRGWSVLAFLALIWTQIFMVNRRGKDLKKIAAFNEAKFLFCLSP